MKICRWVKRKRPYIYSSNGLAGWQLFVDLSYTTEKGGGRVKQCKLYEYSSSKSIHPIVISQIAYHF